MRFRSVGEKKSPHLTHPHVLPSDLHPPHSPPPSPPPALVSSQHLSLCLCRQAPLSLSSSPPPPATRRITKVVECNAASPLPPPLDETREQVQKDAAGLKLSGAHSGLFFFFFKGHAIEVSGF